MILYLWDIHLHGFLTLDHLLYLSQSSFGWRQNMVFLDQWNLLFGSIVNLFLNNFMLLLFKRRVVSLLLLRRYFDFMILMALIQVLSRPTLLDRLRLFISFFFIRCDLLFWTIIFTILIVLINFKDHPILLLIERIQKVRVIFLNLWDLVVSLGSSVGVIWVWFQVPVISCVNELIGRVNVMMIDAVGKRYHACFWQPPPEASGYHRYEAMQEESLHVFLLLRVLYPWEVVLIPILWECHVDEFKLYLKFLSIVQDVLLENLILELIYLFWFPKHWDVTEVDNLKVRVPKGLLFFQVLKEYVGSEHQILCVVMCLINVRMTVYDECDLWSSHCTFLYYQSVGHE